MAVSTSKDGGIYITIGAETRPLYDALQDVNRRASWAAKDIAKSFDGALGTIDAGKIMSGVTRSFAQLKAAAQGASADLSAYQKHFQNLGKDIGLSGKQLDVFGKSMEAAFRRRNQSDMLSSLRSIQRELGLTTEEANKLAKSLNIKVTLPSRDNRNMATLKSQLLDLGKSMVGVNAGLVGLATGFVSFQKAALETSMQMERLHQAYKTIFSGGADNQLNFIYEQSKAVGQQFMASAEAAKTFFAAASNTSLAPQMNDIYKAVSNAGAAMQLTSDQMQGVFLALGQMVSKGKVQAEELRGQLGERLPGAFQMAAQAMGMTTAELDKFIADGKLTAEELLPKLAEVMQEKFAGAAEQAADTVQGTLNNLYNEWERFKNNLAASGPATFVMRIVTEVLHNVNESQAQDALRDKAIKYLKATGAEPDYELDETGYLHEFSDASIKRAINQMQSEDEDYGNMAQFIAAKSAEAEKVISNARQAFSSALKKSEYGKRKDLEDARKASEEAYKTLRESYLKPDAFSDENARKKALEDLDAQWASIKKAWDDKLNNLGKSGGKGGGGGGLANRQFKFDTGLEQLRQEVENMEAVLDPAAQGIERMRQKLELERQNAIAAAEAHAKLSVQRKEATPEEAEERKALEIRKAELTYAQKMGQVEAKNRDVRVKFYQELAQLSGNYTESIRLQTEALREQAREFEGAGIASNIVKQWEELKKLEMARDPFSGMVRGLRKYGAEATDLASQLESVVTSSFSGMEDAFVQFVTTGKLSFTDLANSIISDLARIAIRAAITGPLAQGIGSLFSGFFGGSGAASAVGSVSSAVSSIGGSGGAFFGGGIGGMFHAKGGAYYGGSIADYANSIVDTPTYFNLGSRITAFARGAGVMGEAGAEAIMPLRRGADGRLGVEMHGDGGNQQQGGNVQVNIINSTGEQVSQQTRTDNYGNKTIDVMIGDAAAAQAQKPGSRLNKVMRSVTGTQQQVVRR